MRTLTARLFEYRISKTQRRLNDLHKQRDETIEKLKTATKYNSTQQLLEKYGGESPKPSPSPQAEAEKRKPPTPSQPPAPRTGLPPPPTANIRHPQPPPPTNPNPPSPPPQTPVQQPPPFSNPSPAPPPVDEPGFAPNAFPTAPAGQYIEQPHWYDRLLDVLLGEDEMQPRNRMAMICGSCRLVNGQAPPGIKTPEELGRWRCGSCGAWNGEESETTKILSSLRQNVVEPAWEHAPPEGEPSDEVLRDDQGENENEGGDSEQAEDETSQPVEEDQPVRRSKRGKGGKKP